MAVHHFSVGVAGVETDPNFGACQHACEHMNIDIHTIGEWGRCCHIFDLAHMVDATALLGVARGMLTCRRVSKSNCLAHRGQKLHRATVR